ncbi:MAG TPA: glycosyltransferase family 4 protein [Pyrinomonadaceae bacterium]|nr:glycosyltransferase family 4 protein [Pyrinomonadaceae bacterium]
MHISSARDFGGGERHLVDLCRELVKRGHEVFVALRPTCTWKDRLDLVAEQNFLTVSIRNSFGMFSAKKIGSFVNKHQIDIVHAHLARDYLAASVADRMASRSKLVLTRHVVFPMKPFHKLALRNVDAAIAVSSVVQTELKNIFPPSKIKLIHNGLNFTIANDRQKLGNEFRQFHRIPVDVPLIGTVGELKPLKGQRDLVIAASEIVKKFPDARFVVAGLDHTIDKRFRRELKRLVSVFGLEHQFLWLDWLEDLTPLLSALDVYVAPSHSESFGLATLEAMSNGVPVVSTATDGAKEMIDDHDLLVPIEDPIAISKMVDELLSSSENAREIAERLRSSARSRYSLDTMVDRTESLYNELIASRS